MPTQIVAGDSTNEATFTGSNDGAFLIRTGPSGAKVDAFKLTAEGYPQFLRGTQSSPFDISASVASNALTVTLNAGHAITFRSTTLSSGSSVTLVNSTAISVIVPTSATLGTVNAVASRLAILAINNTGTVELAVVNLAGGTQLDETGVINTTTISASATSASTVYSSAGRTGVAYRVVGFVDSTQATAGTWTSTPTLVQGAGGQALSALSSIGYSQTWQDVTGSRVSGTTYYNTTGRPIYVTSKTTVSTDNVIYLTLTVNGLAVNYAGYGRSGMGDNGSDCVAAIIPPGGSYSISGSFAGWYELR